MPVPPPGNARRLGRPLGRRIGQRIAGALALALALASGLECAAPRPAQTPISNTGGRPAAPRASELDVLVAAVLARLTEERGIPDAAMLPSGSPIYVLTEVEVEDKTDHIRTLPSGPRPFVGKTFAELRSEADKSGDPVVFVQFYSITFANQGQTAFVTIGANVTLPGGAPKQCCCHAKDRYDRRDGRWTFTSRGDEVCS